MQKSNDFSINLMIPFLRYFGFWMPSGRDQETFYYFLLFISYVQICLIVIGAMYEILFHFTDLTTWLYCLITFVSSFTSFFKLTAILPHRKDFFHLILYLQKNFLDSKYNDHERSLLTACKQTSTLFICTFIFFTYTTVIGYILGPFIENRGKNESDRILILSVRMDVFSFSPYYEIMYAVQAVCVLKVGVVYHSYDNFLYIMNLHVTTQFRILHRRLESLASDYCSGTVVRIASDSASNGPHDGEECYATFRKYIQHHQSLLAYCKKLNKVFNVYALGQVILFTLILCFDAYQVLMFEQLIDATHGFTGRRASLEESNFCLSHARLSRAIVYVHLLLRRFDPRERERGCVGVHGSVDEFANEQTWKADARQLEVYPPEVYRTLSHHRLQILPRFARDLY
ncbi:uncharacterized protein LOC143259689 isoform X2 [Megalopta genalis]|uniref:uncharacterized protein LOC143259689 isoform X2 n=1 Tax=Megalopta genalis TaxID=115081 RepID=UPI003FD1D4FB